MELLEEDEHAECPFFSSIKRMFSHAEIKKEHEPEEAHESPFYTVTDEEPMDPESIYDPLATPTAVFHGLGDACIFPGPIQLDKEIQKGTGAYATCIEVGLPSLGELFNNLEHVAEKSCQKLLENEHFQGDFNVVGVSQGGLLARYIVEECDIKGKVRNLVTLAGPHMGVDSVPHCTSGWFCDFCNSIIKKLVYIPFIQNWVVPAGYFRDVNNMAEYLKRSVFLPKMNNELSHPGSYSDFRKEKFTALNAAMFVKYASDSVLYPRETAWFQELDQNGKLLPLNATDFYNKDYIGLRNLTESGKAHFLTFAGDHIQTTKEEIQDIIIPFLKQ